MNTVMNVYRKSPFWASFILIMMKMILFRQFTFGEIIIANLLTDAATLLTLLCVVELITTSRWKSVVFGIMNAILSLLLFACCVYFSFFGNIPTYTALHGLDQVGQVKESVESAINIKFYTLFADVLILIALYVATLRSRGKREKSSPAAKPFYVAVGMVITLAASFLYIRMDLDIPNELVQAKRLGVLNYQVATAINESKLNSAIKDGSVEVTQEALEQLELGHSGNSGKVEAGTPNYFGVAKGMNVIVIQLESFQDLMIGLKVDGREVTPVLNDLIGEGSFYFPNVFQQNGQGNTSDSEFISNTGLYATGSVAMSKGFGDREVPSMPRLLGERKYVSNTFHVNDVTFWDRNNMYPALGFTKYYDKPYFNNDNFNAFGASDEEMYRVGLEKLTELHEQNQPFYAQFVTTSSHHPFWVPASFLNIQVPERLLGSQLGHYIAAINYTDKAIGELIDGLKKNDMWNNTVIMLYGDHYGLQTKDNDPAWVKEMLGVDYHDRISRLNVPFIIRVPGVKGKPVEQVGGHVDMMPTLANLLGIDLKEENFTFFGKDLLNTTSNVIGVRYYMPTGSFFNDEIMFVPGEGFDDGEAFDLKTFEKIEDISQYRSDYDYVLELMRLSDAYVKLLPKRTH